MLLLVYPVKEPQSRIQHCSLATVDPRWRSHGAALSASTFRYFPIYTAISLQAVREFTVSFFRSLTYVAMEVTEVFRLRILEKKSSRMLASISGSWRRTLATTTQRIRGSRKWLQLLAYRSRGASKKKREGKDTAPQETAE